MKIFIENRKKQKICVVVEGDNNPNGLAFVMHGLSGNKDQKHIRTFVESFLDCGYKVVSFDTSNTYGESDGAPEDATTTSYLEDLEDVIAWTKSQNWYSEPFILCGHSLGAFAVALYAERNPKKTEGLAPISTVVSGQLSAESSEKESLEQWKKDGYKITPSSTRPDLMKKIKWGEFEDRLKYDLLTQVHQLSMPVLLLTGSQDKSTPPNHQKILFDRLPGKKEFHIIVGAAHTFTDPKHLAEIKNNLINWIKTL